MRVWGPSAAIASIRARTLSMSGVWTGVITPRKREPENSRSVPVTVKRIYGPIVAKRLRTAKYAGLVEKSVRRSPK